MKNHFWRNIITIIFFCLPLYSCFYPLQHQDYNKCVYVSDLKIIHFGDVSGGVGLDKPYWTDKLVICGINFKKGVIVHPKDGSKVAFVEFLLPRKGGRLLGLAGCAEETGGEYIHKMNFRFYVDGEFLYGKEMYGSDCQQLDLKLGPGKVLRIETDDGHDGNYYDHMAFGDLRIEY
jgi:hypothetical protein